MKLADSEYIRRDGDRSAVVELTRILNVEIYFSLALQFLALLSPTPPRQGGSETPKKRRQNHRGCAKLPVP